MSVQRTLKVKKIINAPAGLLFECWLSAEHLLNWWGPDDVQCVNAELDPVPGGKYRILNRVGAERFVQISGEFKIIEPPRKLQFTWNVDGMAEEVVTVLFAPAGVKTASMKTEITVIHQRIVDAAVCESHRRGWQGCLANLETYADSTGKNPKEIQPFSNLRGQPSEKAD